MVAGDRRRPAASSSNSVMTLLGLERRAASIAEESRAEDIALDARRESRFASVARAAAVLSGPSDLPQSGGGRYRPAGRSHLASSRPGGVVRRSLLRNRWYYRLPSSAS